MTNFFYSGSNTNKSDPPNNYYTRHNFADNYLITFFKTPFIYKKEDKLFTCEKFHYIINPPFAVCEHGSSGGETVNDFIFVKGDIIGEIISLFDLPVNTAFKIDNHSIIEPYLKKINAEWVLKQTGYEQKIRILVTDMLISLGRQYELIQRNSHPAFSVINDARTFMLENINKKLCLDSLAARTSYSISHFCALYSQFFGSTPIDDLLSARIEKAVSLLEYSYMSINEISEKCGFSSVSYFSRKFKEKTGLSPSCYRKN